MPVANTASNKTLKPAKASHAVSSDGMGTPPTARIMPDCPMTRLPRDEFDAEVFEAPFGAD
ncbi:hypothetical protein GCM10011273_14700 [Asticcacaulis endophyticus]|uniref:Uncharacterized protein n=1 Tax=Asticcacaulis endophyticus TaxID=1395890 RepID=A0A918URW3_9CAUL|nr:hypothetical protein GCM10011273_14700 [Asticcacaulis endophyticus]